MRLLVILLFISSKTLMATMIPAGSTTGGPQVIGGIYNSENDYFDGGVKCLEVDPHEDIEIIFNEVATVNLASTIDYKTLERELSRGAGADITLNSGDRFGFTADFLRKSKETETSIVFVYKTILKAGDEILRTPYRLTEEAKKLADLGGDVFKKYCGDQFVYKISKGARAYVVVKVELGTEKKKEEVKAGFHIGFVDLIDIQTTLKTLREKFQVKGDVKIFGYQEGGFAGRINSIFGNGTGVSSCSAPDLRDCELTIANVLGYFSREFPLQFEPYYRDNHGSGVILLPSTSFPLIYTTQSYCKLPPTERPSNINCDEPFNLRNLIWLRGLLEKYLKNLKMLNEIRINAKHSLSKPSEELLSKIEGQMNDNIGKVKSAVENCDKDRWSCKSITSKIELELIPLDPEEIEKIKKEDRIEICLETGMTSEIGGFELRFLKGSNVLTSYKSYERPEFGTKSCFFHNASDLVADFDGLELIIKNLTEPNSPKCKIHSLRNSLTGYDLDLKEVKVINYSTGHQFNFKGDRYRKKMKCSFEDEGKNFSDLIKLKLKNET
ncbi:MAG: hypothetical protein ACHQYQ_01605 [Bacteriovoracales bacterium]